MPCDVGAMFRVTPGVGESPLLVTPIFYMGAFMSFIQRRSEKRKFSLPTNTFFSFSWAVLGFELKDLYL
jgi:hypothetical protein